jgi:type III restriction enzyme
VQSKFRFNRADVLLSDITDVNDFRNTYVAHAEKELRDRSIAEDNLRKWTATLVLVVGS